MILRKYQINSTLRFYATLSALQLLCFNKNPDDGGGNNNNNYYWNSNNNNQTDFLLQQQQQHPSDENIFIDLFPEELATISAIIRNQNDMNMRKILEESTFQSWQSHIARKSLLEDLIRFDRNDDDSDHRRITLYPLDIRNETKIEIQKTNTTTSTSTNQETTTTNSQYNISSDRISLNSLYNSHNSDSDRPFSLFQLPNDTRNFDSLAAYGLDERKPSTSASFGDFLTQDVFLDNSFYDIHLNTISSSTTSFPSSSSSSSTSASSLPSSSTSSSSSAYGKSKRNPLKKDAVLPNINRIRRQDIDFFNRFGRDVESSHNETTTFSPSALLEIKKEELDSEEEEEGAAAAMREQETLAMMTTSIYKQDVDLGYTFANYNPSYTILSPPIEEVEKVEVIQNLNDTSKGVDSNEHGIDIGYLLSLSASTPSNNDRNTTNSSSSQQKLLKIDEDRKLAEILYEQDIDLGYILSTEDSKDSSSSSSSKKQNDKSLDKKILDKEDSNDVSDLWAGIPFKIDNETGEYIRLPFEEILKDLIPMEDEAIPKDEDTKAEEPTSPLDLDATIADIANLLTPNGSGFFGGVQNSQVVAPPPPPPLFNNYHHHQPQQVYPGYNDPNHYEANMGQAGASHPSNTLYAASGGNQDEALHSDAYLDSILKMMDANETQHSTGKQAGNPIDNSNANGGAGGGAKNSSNKAPNSDANVPSFLDLSCGSAGSSLGSLSSESLPSDNEWGEGGSDHGNDYHRSNFYGPYDYSSNNSSNFTLAPTTQVRQVPVAQKKYHMFGKRFQQEEKILKNNTLTDSTRINTLQPENPVNDLVEGKENSTFDDEFDEEMKVHANMKNISKIIKPGPKTDPDKFKASSDEHLVRHNHTYAMSHSSDSNSALEHDGSEYGDLPSEEGHLTRDEKRARNLNIPIAVYDIINLPMDEFNERVSKYDLSENQLSLIRDIRRRGKNKVAAQNCRKRKLDTILTLESEVEKVRRRKEELHNDKVYVAMEKKRIASKFAALHKHIFGYLKDEDGKPVSPSKFSFQQSQNGSMFLAPRDSNAKQDPNCYGMALLMSGPSTSSACRDRSRMKDASSMGAASGRRTKPDETESITEL